MEKIPQVEYSEVGWYDIWEKMLAQAMNITSEDVKNYVKENKDNGLAG